MQLLQPRADLVTAFEITGVRSTAAVFEFVSSSLTTVLSTASDSSQLLALCLDIHHRLVKEGNQADHLTRYGFESHGWSMASCELLVLCRRSELIEFCQIGTIHCCKRSAGSLELCAPVHNVWWECHRNTIEESQLGPFAARSIEHVATQILFDCQHLVPTVVSGMDRMGFVQQIGHFHTRTLGFYPSHHPNRQKPVYSSRNPAPEIGTFRIQNGENLYLFDPRCVKPRPYDFDYLTQNLQQLPAGCVVTIGCELSNKLVIATGVPSPTVSDH